MRQRHIPEFVARQVFDEPDGVEPSTVEHGPDREIRWRVYDSQRVEIVVDRNEEMIVTAWVSRVK